MHKPKPQDPMAPITTCSVCLHELRFMPAGQGYVHPDGYVLGVGDDPDEPIAAAFEAGYASLAEFVSGMTVAEAQHVLDQRKASVDHRMAFNRGGSAAVEDYLKKEVGEQS